MFGSSFLHLPILQKALEPLTEIYVFFTINSNFLPRCVLATGTCPVVKIIYLPTSPLRTVLRSWETISKLIILSLDYKFFNFFLRLLTNFCQHPQPSFFLLLNLQSLFKGKIIIENGIESSPKQLVESTFINWICQHVNL